MPASRMHVGVDFGTSNTVAVLRWADGRARSLIFDGSPLLPSAVYAEPAGGLVVGRDAVHSARLDPGRFEPNPKRRIDDGQVLLGDRELAVGELVGAVLGRVADELRRTAGGAKAVDATLTCPASWGATRRRVLADAARAAGLGEVRLVPEPVAAATYFTQVLGRDVPIGSVVVVYDFGAGTIDASVVARTSGGFEVLAVDGRDDIGGLDVDAAIVDLIGAVCKERDAAAWERLAHPATVEDRRARRLLWDDARGAKERLSRHPTADVTVPLLETDVHLTRHELEERVRPLLDRTVQLTQGVVGWAKLAEGRIAGVFLVGGSSRIPLVATLLHRALGEAPVAIEQPELVVAEGSLLASSAAVPVAAAPSPGPATGSIPVQRDPSDGRVDGGVDGPTAVTAAVTVRAARPVSPAADDAQTVSGPLAASPARTRQLPRYEPAAAAAAPVYRPGSATPAAPLRPAYERYEPDYEPAAEPAYEPARAYRGRRGSGVLRVFRALVLTALFIGVPVAAFLAVYAYEAGYGPYVREIISRYIR